MDPMTQMQNNPVVQWWKGAYQTHLEQMNTVFGQFMEIEATGQKNANAAVDEMARLSKASMDAALEMQTAWRNIAVSMTKSTMDAAQAAASQTSDD